MGYNGRMPAHVRYDANLSDGARVLFVEISATVNADGCCRKTNEYFSKALGITPRAVRERLLLLDRAGHVERKLDDGHYRRLWPVDRVVKAEELPAVVRADMPTGAEPELLESIRAAKKSPKSHTQQTTFTREDALRDYGEFPVLAAERFREMLKVRLPIIAKSKVDDDTYRIWTRAVHDCMRLDKLTEDDFDTIFKYFAGGKSWHFNSGTVQSLAKLREYKYNQTLNPTTKKRVRGERQCQYHQWFLQEAANVSAEARRKRPNEPSYDLDYGFDISRFSKTEPVTPDVV